MNMKPPEDIVFNKDSKDTFSLSKESGGESLLRYLDSEIGYIRSESQEPGWTKWAILGSLATSLWLLLDKIENGAFQLSTILLLLLVASIVYDTINFFPISIKNQLVTFSEDRFFLTNNKINQNRLPVLIGILRQCFNFYVILIYAREVAASATAAIIIIDSYLVLLHIIILSLSFVKVPLPNQIKEQSTTTKVVTFLVPFLVIFYSLLNYLALIFQSKIIITITDLRIATLSIAIYYLLSLFVKVTGAPPLLNSLVSIRRDLALGHTKTEDAIEQIDIAIAGLKISHLFQGYIEDYLKVVEEFKSELQKAISKLNTLEKTLKISNLSEEQTSIIEALSDSISKHINNAGIIAEKKLDAALTPIEWRVKLIRQVGNVSVEEVDDVVNKIREAWENGQKDFHELQEKTMSITKNIVKIKKTRKSKNLS